MKPFSPPPNRRHFLRQASAIALSASWWTPQVSGQPSGGRGALLGGDDGSRIEKIESFAVRYPMTGHFKFFTGPHGGKGRASVLVKVTTADGLVGWGQSVPIAKWS